MIPRKRQFTKPIALALSKKQIKALDSIVKKEHYRNKQQLIRELINERILASATRL